MSILRTSITKLADIMDKHYLVSARIRSLQTNNVVRSKIWLNLTKIGKGGFKKSLRHNNFVPDIAIVDPELTLSCPSNSTAACGMDAFTQLLESYVSTNASVITDCLAYNGMKHVIRSLCRAVSTPDDLAARTDVSYASLISGITLANAGLGVVHGFASSIGGFFDIPHGVVCGTLMAVSTKFNIAKLRRQANPNITLTKYANIGKLMTNSSDKTDAYYCDLLVETLYNWTEKFDIPTLDQFAVSENDFKRIIDITLQKQNPAALDKHSLELILKERVL